MPVSIIIPTYAPGEYIYDCLHSLLVQTSGHKSFEIIVVLNGQKDPYFSGIQNYLSKHDFRFNLLYTEEKGVSNARNIGLDFIASRDSQYVVFLDDDDKLSPNFIEEVSKNTDPNIVVASNSKFFDDQNNIEGKDYVSECYENNVNISYNIFKYRCLLSNATAKLFPLTVIDKTRFNRNFAIGEDALFSFTISNKIKRIVLTGYNTFYIRRVRSNSASRRRKGRLGKLKNSWRLCIAYSKIYFKNPFGYNFLFYISRMVAVIIRVFK